MTGFFTLAGILAAMLAVQLPEPDSASLIRDFSSAMTSLEATSPRVLQHIRKTDPKTRMAALLKTLDSGVIPASEYSEPAKPDEIPEPYPAKLVFSNSIFYARVDCLNGRAFQQLEADQITSARLSSPPIGAILDLRNARSGDYAAVNRFYGLFSSADAAKKSCFRKIPLVILCGRKTSGAPELLTARLAASKRAITLGGQTAGHVFPMVPMTCAGVDWMVPQIDDPAWTDVSPSAHVPLVSFEPYPQIPFEKIGKTDLGAADTAIRRAADLLHGLHAVLPIESKQK